MKQIYKKEEVTNEHTQWFLSRLIHTYKKFDNKWSNEDLSRMVARVIKAEARHSIVAILTARGALVHNTEQTSTRGRVINVDTYSLSSSVLETVGDPIPGQANVHQLHDQSTLPTRPPLSAKNTVMTHTCPHCSGNITVTTSVDLTAFHMEPAEPIEPTEPAEPTEPQPNRPDTVIKTEDYF